MKKITALLLAIVMMFGLAACKNDTPDDSVNTEATESTEHNLRQPNKVEDTLCLVFEDDKASLTMSRSLLDIASQKMYEETLADNDKNYDAILKKVILDIYDANNQENEHHTIYFRMDHDLFSQEDLVLTIDKNTVEAEDVADVYPIDIMHTIQRMGYEKYGITATCVYMRVYDDTKIGDQFEFTGTLKMEDKTTDDALTDVYLHETGANVTLSFDELLKYMGKTRQDVKPGDALRIEYAEIFVSGYKSFVTNNEEIMIQISEEHPDELTLELAYEDALNQNDILFDTNKEAAQYCYVLAGIEYISGDESHRCNFYARVNLIKEYANQATEPTSET